MFAQPLKRLAAAPLIRLFSLYAFASQEIAIRHPSPKLTATKDPKKIAAREAKLRARQQVKPQDHLLYMDIPKAMRFMRASEVGKSPEMTTITLQITVIPEKGSHPLLGQIIFPKPVRPNNTLIFTENAEQIQEIKRSKELTLVGGADLIAKIKEGFPVASYTQCLADSNMVLQLGQIAKILGPKNLMPSAKKGTVSDNVVDLLKNTASAYTFKQKKNQLYFPVGRCDFSDEEIIKNVQAASKAVYSCQPPGTKHPNLIGLCSMSSTLGPSVIIDFKL
ncbi:ribosomal protein L1 [Metschnikowia bicuspidata var. bicuspidata NRRL YB-4993]|uniref:Ribosomal protein n=1 Tax=Metschnikowia bicuspidata var. bicuspidata NRRL YB-4993 TaxID=869754 RepID=A0A1A0H889_9ASCO|nr:ribosomal protein L1 [Metschnikowia bicuspidata var. bicuspidata NRRL YB-4993]OBA20195.1 ribosomal protein L1 [Metschnikowia bicuspidata var. bicuspidata NRRL YB-4993]